MLLFWAYALLACTVQVVESQARNDQAALLQSCLKASTQQDEQGATFRAFLDGQHARLRLHQLLWSSKQPCQKPSDPAATPQSADSGLTGSGSSDDCALTVVTTLTASRLNGLEQLCRSWPGPLVAALYVPLEQQATGPSSPGLAAISTERLNNDTRAAMDVFTRLESQPQSCALRVLIMYEVLSEPVMHLLLPINSLRNAALLAASSPLVAMIDVDLVVSASLGRQLIMGPEAERQQRSSELVRLVQDRTALILPALEPHTGRRAAMDQLLTWADRSVQGSKSELVSMVSAQEMCFFQELSYPRGHRLTDFPRWFKAQWPYQVHWQMFYEPWFLLSRANNPWYDVRFQGYGYNKQNHVAGLAISGFRFLVHPDAWVVHRPHDKTAVHRLYVVALNARAKMQKAGRDVQLARNFTHASELSSAQVGALLQHHVKTMFLENQREAKAGKYVPQIDAATQRCLRALPWWNNTPSVRA